MHKPINAQIHSSSIYNRENPSASMLCIVVTAIREKACLDEATQKAKKSGLKSDYSHY